MTKTTQKTRIEMFATIKAEIEKGASQEKAEMLEFITHQMELLESKKAKSGGASEKRKAESLALGEKVLEIMRGKAPMTATQIYKECEKVGLTEVTSSQKVVSLMKQLGEEKVVRTIEKKTAYFSVV